ncbi:MAG TPA: magnesium/cobalt transporter CorA [Chthoniobacterales bacterium]|nr:magnesium/cobalt transporter CorA [Chthoniobacterales bacterium]
MNKVRYSRPGTAPATLVAPPDQEGHKPEILLIEYDAHAIQEKKVERIEETFSSLENGKVNWINISGLGDVEMLRQVGLKFRIHPLALEDMLNTGQRPKVEEYENQLFIVLQMAYSTNVDEIAFEQVCMVLGKHFVITVQEEAGRDVFDPVRLRLHQGGGNARYMKADYLAYALVDAVVDHYFPVVESLGDSIEEFQETVLNDPTRERLRQLHDFRRAIAELRRAVWPQRDVLGRLTRDETGLIEGETKYFFRDCYDHAMIVLDLLETFRDATRNLMDLYLSSLSLRTNEVIRVLTVISSIFIPLTFIAGVYGMNFDRSTSGLNMPELGWHFGYLYAIGLMLAVAVGMILFFKRKKWL